jgi:hypothetical protein
MGCTTVYNQSSTVPSQEYQDLLPRPLSLGENGAISTFHTIKMLGKSLNERLPITTPFLVWGCDSRSCSWYTFSRGLGLLGIDTEDKRMDKGIARIPIRSEPLKCWLALVRHDQIRTGRRSKQGHGVSTDAGEIRNPPRYYCTCSVEFHVVARNAHQKGPGRQERVLQLLGRWSENTNWSTEPRQWLE